MFTDGFQKAFESGGKRLNRKNSGLGRLPGRIEGEQTHVSANIKNYPVGSFDAINLPQKNLPKSLNVRQFLQTDAISSPKTQKTRIGKLGKPQISTRDLRPLRCLPGTAENFRSPVGVF